MQYSVLLVFATLPRHSIDPEYHILRLDCLYEPEYLDVLIRGSFVLVLSHATATVLRHSIDFGQNMFVHNLILYKMTGVAITSGNFNITFSNYKAAYLITFQRSQRDEENPYH